MMPRREWTGEGHPLWQDDEAAFRSGLDQSEHLDGFGEVSPIGDMELDSPPKGSSRNESSFEGLLSLPFAPIGTALAGVPEDPEWLWDGYVAPGSITLPAGRPKVGKTTFVFGLLAALQDGTPFLGRATRQTKTLLLTEERPATLAEKQRRWGLRDDSVHVLMRHQASALSWPEILAEAVEYCAQHGIQLLVIDTFDKWVGLGGDAENSSGAVNAAVQPLLEAAGTGLAVMLVTHQRKAPGRNGDAVRGSNALAGAVDVIIEVERVHQGARNVRQLTSVSRFAGTPESLSFSYGPDGFDTFDLEAASADARSDRILGLLGADPLTTTEVATAAGESKIATGKALTELLASGKAVRLGQGVRGDPQTWILSTPTQPFRDESNSNGDRAELW